MLTTIRNEAVATADQRVRPRPAAAPRLTRPVTYAAPVKEHRAWEMVQRGLAMQLLIFAAPVMLVIAILLWVQGGPIMFRHERIGRGGKSFGCLKFRTMAVDAQERLTELLARDETALREWLRDQKLRHDPRITRLGRILRTTSLDELPQLFNVVLGDMNLVGPRPIVTDEIPRYARRFRSYTAVKPGITGLWQISGRNELTYDRRVALDVLYTRRRSPWLDLLIILRTLPAVLLRHGA
jgi:lipopolysaccharide/colanic/teichoic acid biosynthesis glycosyltransferase